jgi:hypothetical protein
MPPLTGTSSRTTPWTASVSPGCSPSSTSTPWSRALQIKEKATAGEGDEDVVVTALTVGPDEASDAIKKALQMGADKGVHVVDDAIAGSDSLATSQDDPTLGYRFLTDELAGVGIVASENRVWRLCSAAGVFASHAPKRSKAGKPGPPVHGDLLAVVEEKGRLTHDFTADRPNQKWLTDITEHPTAEGKLYWCEIKDCYSDKIVGYSLDSRVKSSLAAAALPTRSPCDHRTARRVTPTGAVSSGRRRSSGS